MTDTATYGSDRNGLIWGYRFVPGRPAEEVDSEAAATWCASTSRSDGFLWLHFSLSNTAAENWVRSRLALPEAFHESLRQQAGSTRLEQDEESLVAVIHDVTFDFTFDPADVSTVSLSLQPRLLVSARLRPLKSLDVLRAEVRSGRQFRSPAELFAQLLRAQAGVLTDIVRQTTARVDAIEDTILEAKASVGRRRELGSLRRVLVRLQRLLAPEPAALFRLLNKPPPWLTEDDVQDLRQVAEEFSAAVTDSVALTERVRLLQEELTAMTSEETGRTLFVLTIVTVLALPVNMIAGLFGMNVGGIPFGQSSNGFTIIVLLLATLTGLLAYRALGRKRR